MAFNQEILKILKKCKEATGVTLEIAVSEKSLYAPSDFLELKVFEKIKPLLTSYEKPMAKGTKIYFPLRENGEITGLLCAPNNEKGNVAAKLLLNSIRELYDQKPEGNNRSEFLKKILSGKIAPSELRKYAEEKEIVFPFPRVLFLLETDRENDDLYHVLNQFYLEDPGTCIAPTGKNKVVISIPVSKDDDDDTLREMAETIHEVVLSEAMMESSVAYGNPAEDFSGMKESLRTAKIALEIGKIFNPEKHIHIYRSQGIGRIIYQLPYNFCEDFLNEVFPESRREKMDRELIQTIEQMLKSNLVISDAARELYIHRNTLIYRIDKIQKITNLDLRKFEDAEVLSLGLTVGKYMKYLSEELKNE